MLYWMSCSPRIFIEKKSKVEGRVSLLMFFFTNCQWEKLVKKFEGKDRVTETKLKTFHLRSKANRDENSLQTNGLFRLVCVEDSTQ